MFEHSVKVPRHYKIAANIFKKVSTEGGSVKTLLYDDKLRHFRTNVLYALITETSKHAIDINKLFEFTGILENEPRLDPWLAKVLVAELLFGKKCLPGKSKPEQTILSYKDKFEEYTSQHQDHFKNEVITRRPRYVRINTNLFTTSDAIGAFQDEGYRFIRCTSGSYNDYLDQVKNLTEYDFTQDYHVKTIFVFSAGTKFHEHELYLENKIILQDKATAMAVHLLAPPAGSVVLDMCAAPGMKTTQLAAYMRNNGKIYAVERNDKRYQTLCDFVQKTGSKCVQTLNKDVLEIRKGEYEDVEYIILDPSCSASGMDFSVHNYIEEARLSKLTSLQEKFLKHAMNAFPKAKRIVYSTCSLYPEENERVVTNVVKTSRTKWKVLDIKELLKEQWNNFGSGMYGTIGARCMYAKPDTDFTTGFFLAVLDRDEVANEMQDSNKTSKRKKTDNFESNDDGIVSEENKVKIKKRKLTKNFKDNTEIVNENHDSGYNCAEEIQNITEPEPIDNKNIDGKKKKKKKKNKDTDLDSNPDVTPYCGDNINVEITVTDEVGKPKSNHKKRTKKESNDNEISNDCPTLDADDLAHMDGKPRSKQRKRTKNESNSNELSNGNPIVDADDLAHIDGKPKSKHKKRTKKESNDNEILNDCPTLDADDLAHMDGKPRSKQRKRTKNESNSNELSNGNPIVDADDLAHIDGKPKSKHKKRTKKESNDNEILNDCPTLDADDLAHMDGKPRSKQRKRTKNESNSNELSNGNPIVDADDLAHIDGKPKSKHKKRTKKESNDNEILNDCPTVDADDLADTDGKSSTKRKKKKKTSM